MKRTLFAFTTAALLASGSASADIIISQYYEGASFDKYIEITNTGGSAVDLGAGNYQISHWSNSGNREGWKSDGTPTGTFALTGSLAAGASIVIENTQAANPSYVVGTPATGNGGVNFNGDDSVTIWTGTTFSTASVVDVFGLTGSGFGETSYVRNASITSGTTSDFNASDWTEYSLSDVANAAATDTEYLGSHTFVPEPSSLALLGLGGLLIARRRRG